MSEGKKVEKNVEENRAEYKNNRRKNMDKKNVQVSKYNRMVRTVRGEMSSFNVYQKLSRQYFYPFNENNIIILRR